MRIAVNGTHLYFDVEGSELVARGAIMERRPTVILLHGGPGADHALFKPAYSRLAQIAQVIYLDHRGNGRSDHDDPTNWTLAQWGDDVHAFCDALDIQRPIVIGVSFGGFVAQSYLTRHPGHAAAAILVSTAAHVEFNAIFEAFGRLGGPAVRDAAQNYWQEPTAERRATYRDVCLPYYTTHHASPDWLSRVIFKDDVAIHFNGPHNEHGRMDFRDALANVRCPVLVMGGDRDPITPIAFSATIARALPSEHVQFERFENCGHGIIGDDPERAFGVIEDFVRRVGVAA